MRLGRLLPLSVALVQNINILTLGNPDGVGVFFPEGAAWHHHQAYRLQCKRSCRPGFSQLGFN